MGPKLAAAIMVGALVGLSLSTPVAASNKQGLYWGISVGQRFDYQLTDVSTVNGSTKTTGQSYYIIVNSLPDMPESVTRLSDLPEWSGYSTYFDNGTVWNEGYMTDVIPAGNWSLMTSLWSSWPSLNNPDIIDTQVLAGFNASYSVPNYAQSDFMAYQKSTGILYESRVELDYLHPYEHYAMEIRLVESSDWAVITVSAAVIVGELLSQL